MVYLLIYVDYLDSGSIWLWPFLKEEAFECISGDEGILCCGDDVLSDL